MIDWGLWSSATFAPIRSARSKVESMRTWEPLGAGCGAEGVKALPELSLDLFQPYGMDWTKR
jgi:hypothetical protein